MDDEQNEEPEDDKAGSSDKPASQVVPKESEPDWSKNRGNRLVHFVRAHSDSS